MQNLQLVYIQAALFFCLLRLSNIPLYMWTISSSSIQEESKNCEREISHCVSQGSNHVQNNKRKDAGQLWVDVLLGTTSADTFWDLVLYVINRLEVFGYKQ